MPSGAPSRPRTVAGLRLVRLVGRGGEGEVWEARTSRGEARALKLVRPDALVDADEVDRRGRWLRAVDHPALVGVLRTGLLSGGGLDGWAFVEMPFLDGDSLDEAPPQADALERLAPLAEALDLLHAGAWSGGVPLVHRDVKPANLIGLDDRWVLVDHSTLRDVSAETVTRIGTPVFAAPEVSLGRAGPAADRYSFAVTTVALLTGARGRELAALLDDRSADVPDGVRAALAGDPEQRPVSCADILDRETILLDAPVDRTGVLGDEDADVDGAVGEPGALWLRVAALAAIVLAPLLAAALGMPAWPHVTAAAGVAALAHLVATRRTPGLAVLVPPLAWVWLLADAASADPRRVAYARTVLTPVLVAATVIVAWPPAAMIAAQEAVWLTVPSPADRALPLGLAVGAVVLVIAGVVAARRGGILVQLVCLPLLVLGVPLLLAAALLALPFSLAAGRARGAARLAWDTLVSLGEAFRRPHDGSGFGTSWRSLRDRHNREY